MRLELSRLLLLIVGAFDYDGLFVNAGVCTVCPLGTPRNKDLIVPFLGVAGQNSISCSQLNEYSVTTLVEGQPLCDVVQAHSDYCGCPMSEIHNECNLCSSSTGETPGSSPRNLQDVTPIFETSCDDLDTYLRFLPSELCQSERVQAMQLADAFCGCPGATQSCYMCPDGTNNLQFPDRNIPFYDPSNGLTKPQFNSCQEVADQAFFLSEGESCQQIQEYSDYCGCSSSTVAPTNACSFCPNGGTPVDSTRMIPALGMTCSELDLFVSYLSDDQCSRGAAYQYQLFDYFCGCPNSEIHCPICVNSNSAVMANPDRVVPFLGFDDLDEHNPTCLFLATLGATTDLESTTCDLIQSQGDFCGCDGASEPDEGHGCDYCEGGQPPANGEKRTQFGDTCNELATYLSYLPQEECDSDRVALIRQTDFRYVCFL